MIEFKRITLEDKDILMPYFEAQPYGTCDLSFVNAFAWSGAYNTSYAIKEDMLLLRVGESKEDYGFLIPIGNGDLKKALETLREYTKALSIDLKLYAVPKAAQEQLEEIMPGTFEVTENRDGCDYIYETELLSTYRGKKLHAKKNHVNKFNTVYEWHVEEISPLNIEDCVKIQRVWCEENDCDGADNDKTNETCATLAILESFSKLPVRGLIIYVGDEPAAFSVGSRLTADVFDVHIEKALTKFDGIYSVICMEMAKSCLGSFKFLNREEDLGKEGLRKSKLSYRPYELLAKDIAVCRN